VTHIWIVVGTNSNYDVERALSTLPGKLGPHLVLWTAAEQHNLGVAYEKVSYDRPSLRHNLA
jgi:hypothetical protein